MAVWWCKGGVGSLCLRARVKKGRSLVCTVNGLRVASGVRDISELYVNREGGVCKSRPPRVLPPCGPIIPREGESREGLGAYAIWVPIGRWCYLCTHRALDSMPAYLEKGRSVRSLRSALPLKTSLKRRVVKLRGPIRPNYLMRASCVRGAWERL